jgi:hypothetical protein
LEWAFPGLRRSLLTVGALALTALTIVFFPRNSPEPSLERTRAAAAGILSREQSAVVLGDYWDTYLITALDASHSLVPLPVEGEWNRTPWTVRALQQSSFALVPRAFGDGVGRWDIPPPHWLLQYGVPLELVDSRWGEPEPFHISRYAAVRNQVVPMVPAQPKLDLCRPNQRVEVTLVHALYRGVLLVGTQALAEGASLAVNGEAAPLSQEASLWHAELGSADRPVHQFTLRTGPQEPDPERCGYFGMVVLSAEDPSNLAKKPTTPRG